MRHSRAWGRRLRGLLWVPLLGVLHARVTSRLGAVVAGRFEGEIREIGWKFESTLGCVCVFRAGKSGMLRSPKTTPLPPFEDAGGFVIAAPVFAGLARPSRFVRLLTSLPESPSARARRLLWAEYRS